jgi:hypothetical protein
MRRRARPSRLMDSMAEEDPLTLMPNLFDLSIVLAVAFLLTSLGALGVRNLTSKENWTLVKRSASGQMEVVSRQGKSISVQQLSARKAGGQGMRLGVAYELENGEVIYVPD